MNFKKEIEMLLISLKKLNIDRRMIERDLDYRENYIDQLLSKGGNKLFLKRLKKYHIAKSNISTINVTGDLGKEIGLLKEREIYNSASIAVLEQMIEKVVSDQTGKSIALVSGERKQATEMEAMRLLGVLRKRSDK